MTERGFVTLSDHCALERLMNIWQVTNSVHKIWTKRLIVTKISLSFKKSVKIYLLLIPWQRCHAPAQQELKIFCIYDFDFELSSSFFFIFIVLLFWRHVTFIFGNSRCCQDMC